MRHFTRLAVGAIILLIVFGSVWGMCYFLSHIGFKNAFVMIITADLLALAYSLGAAADSTWSKEQ